MRYKRVTRNSQPGYTKGKSCLTKPRVFYNEMTDSGKRRTVNVFYPNFSKAFDTDFHSS